MKDIKVLGIDLAKNVFQLHGTDKKGKCLLTKRLGRSALIEFMSNLRPCLIGIEACSGAYYWSRVFAEMGHTVKIMAPQFVKPYVRSNKNDRNDARGIAEAVTRPDMKFVSLKTLEQQDMLLIHRSREMIMKQRTAQSNQIRGLLAEYGVIMPKGAAKLNDLEETLEENQDKLSQKALCFFRELYDVYKFLDAQIKKYDKELERVAKKEPIYQELQKVEGIGPITATAIVATIGDPNTFKNGREVSAWLGLVPRQYSSGNTIRLGRISKRGDKYIRKLLIHGARSCVTRCISKTDGRSLWLADKRRRCGFNKACVALANKNARIIWAMLSTGECYRSSKPMASVNVQ
jgi:transposase